MKWGIIVRKSQDFPRAVGNPKRKVVENEREYKRYIKANMRSNNLYTTVYNFDSFSTSENGYKKVDSPTAVIDKIYFDFDPVEEGDDTHWRQTKKLHHFLKERDIAHHIVFSGGGFHVYVYIEYKQFMYKRKMIFNTAKYFVDKLDLDTVDGSIFGDLNQLTRVPNTYNHKEHRQRWCIPLGDRHIDMSFEEIKEEAEEGPNYEFNQFGDKLLDTDHFDRSEYMFDNDRMVGEQDLDMGDVEIKDLGMEDFNPPNCIARVLSKGLDEQHVGHRERLFLISWFKELKYTEAETAEILKQFLRGGKMRKEGYFETDYEHVINDTSQKYGQISFIYERGYRYPDHDRLVAEGFCEEEWGLCCEMAKPNKYR